MDKWLMNNNAAKVIALVLGILLFAVVHKDDSTVVNTPPLMESRWIDSVQVRTIGLDTQQQVIKSMKPETVRIQVRGKRTIIAAALPEDYKVTLDLTGYGTGRHVIPLHHEFPPGIELVSMLPSSVTVDLEDVQTKEFEVQVKTQGIPAKGYKAGTAIVSPSNRVHVTLPASRMAEVKSVTAMVNIEKANESVVSKGVKLTAYNSKGQEIKDAVMTPSVVEVEIPVTKPFKSVPLQVNLEGQLPDGLAVSTLTPDVNQITLYGPQEALDQFEFFDGVRVDLRQIKAEGVYKLNVRLTPPPNIEKIEPSEITVDLQISSVKQRVISGVPIILTGENDRLETTVAEPATRKMDVTVVGAPSLVDELKAADIQLIANVNDLPPGKHTVNLQVNLPRFVRRVENMPLTVTIIIQDNSAPVTTEPDTKPIPPAGGDAGKSEGSQSETGQEEHKPAGQEDAGTSSEANDTSPDSKSENDQSS